MSKTILQPHYFKNCNSWLISRQEKVIAIRENKCLQFDQTSLLEATFKTWHIDIRNRLFTILSHQVLAIWSNFLQTWSFWNFIKEQKKDGNVQFIYLSVENYFYKYFVKFIMFHTNLHQSCWSPPDGMMLDERDKENPICFAFVRLIKAIWAIYFFVQANDGNCPVIYWVCPPANKWVVKEWEKISTWDLFSGYKTDIIYICIIYFCIS